MAVTFEEKLKRLQEIVGMLDQSNITLDDSIKLYEEGMELALELRKMLDEAELKIIHLNAKYQNIDKNSGGSEETRDE
ncbi:MAG: exodeoxyribonuclease VII small subunit [Candidatus Kapaibacteriota bacterium]|jgi:exodeoxyribonuclease VII small subunit